VRASRLRFLREFFLDSIDTLSLYSPHSERRETARYPTSPFLLLRFACCPFTFHPLRPPPSHSHASLSASLAPDHLSLMMHDADVVCLSVCLCAIYLVGAVAAFAVWGGGRAARRPPAAPQPQARLARLSGWLAVCGMRRDRARSLACAYLPLSIYLFIYTYHR
jgi:hypothetical protein